LTGFDIGLLLGSAARQQLFARNAPALGLNLLPQGLGFCFPSLQIAPHLVAMPEVVGDDSVDVSEHQGVVGAHHGFGSHAILVLLDDHVEADATVADADGASFVHPEPGRVGIAARGSAVPEPEEIRRGGEWSGNELSQVEGTQYIAETHSFPLPGRFRLGRRILTP
jgi:hypothetical protein